MNDSDSKETRSYQDPMAPRLKAAQKQREAEEGAFPRASDVYDAFYVQLRELDVEASRFFLGAEAIIGTTLSYDKKTAQLFGGDGSFLAQLEGPPAERLLTHAAAGWNIVALLSTTYFRSQDKCAVVDLAFLCWNPLDAELDAALLAFSQGIADRFAAGSRAEVKLTQEQFVQVLKSKGAWYLTRTLKREPPEKGTVVYKARRSGTERITAYALRHRFGCNILASLFWIAVAAGVVFLVWRFFFN